MAEGTVRTVVCSIAYMDLVAHSLKSAVDQVKGKQLFNEVLVHALRPVPQRDVIVLDTGDGVAIAFLADPDDALRSCAAVRGGIGRQRDRSVNVRLGIHLGTVRLVWDINSQLNILGEGINVAQRLMSFAEPGQLIISQAFYESVISGSPERESAFRRLKPRVDKHGREYTVYEVGELPDAAPTIVEATRPQSPPPPPPAPSEEPPAEAKVLDAGENLMISGTTRSAVEHALKDLLDRGAKLVSAPSQIGNKWIASCGHPLSSPETCTVVTLGLKRIVSGPTLEAVKTKVEELLAVGGVLTAPIEFADGVWTAVCDEGGSHS